MFALASGYPLDSYEPNKPKPPTNNPGIARRNSAAVTLELVLKVQLVQATHLSVKIDALEIWVVPRLLRQWWMY